MQSYSEQEHSGERRPDAMRGNIDNSMQREKNRGDERGEAKALIGTDAQRETLRMRKAAPTRTKRTAGQPSSLHNQSQSLSGWIARLSLKDALRNMAKTDSKFPRPIPHQGEARMRSKVSWKISHRKSDEIPVP